MRQAWVGSNGKPMAHVQTQVKLNTERLINIIRSVFMHCCVLEEYDYCSNLLLEISYICSTNSVFESVFALC